MKPQLELAPFPANPNCLYHAYVLCVGKGAYGDAGPRAAENTPPRPGSATATKHAVRAGVPPDGSSPAEDGSSARTFRAPEASSASAARREKMGAPDRRSARTTRAGTRGTKRASFPDETPNASRATPAYRRV